MVDIWLIIVILFIVTSLLSAINQIYESYPFQKPSDYFFYSVDQGVFIYGGSDHGCQCISQQISGTFDCGFKCFCCSVIIDFQRLYSGFCGRYTVDSQSYDPYWRLDPDGQKQCQRDGTRDQSLYCESTELGYDYFNHSNLSAGFRILLIGGGWQESDGRRIMRSINVDIHSVHFLSHEEIEKFTNSAFLKDYIDQMLNKLGNINKDKMTILDERKLTNIGIFRYYMDAWLEANPTLISI